MTTTRPIRFLLAALGVVCVALGAIGVFVPGLPTTVFLIAASYLFIRSCPVLEEHLVRNRIFRPYLRYVDGEPMPRALQARALALMWGAVAASMVVLQLGGKLQPWMAALIVTAGCWGTLVIVRRGKSRSLAPEPLLELQTDSPRPRDQSRR